MFFLFFFFQRGAASGAGGLRRLISARGSVRAGCGVAAGTAPGQGSSPRRCSLARGRRCGHSARRPPGSPSHPHRPRPVRQACRPDHEALRWAQHRRRVHWASKRARSCEGRLRGRLWSGAGVGNLPQSKAPTPPEHQAGADRYLRPEDLPGPARLFLIRVLRASSKWPRPGHPLITAL